MLFTDIIGNMKLALEKYQLESAPWSYIGNLLNRLIILVLANITDLI